MDGADQNTDYTPADPAAVKDLWLECMKGADSRGNLERQPTIRARTPKERDTAKKQNYALTRKSFGMPDTDWHERIFGRKEA